MIVCAAENRIELLDHFSEQVLDPLYIMSIGLPRTSGLSGVHVCSPMSVVRSP